MKTQLDTLLDIEDKLALLGTRLANAAQANPTLAADEAKFEELRRKVKTDINRLLASELDGASTQLQGAVDKFAPVTKKLNDAIQTTAAAASGLDIASQVLGVVAQVAVYLATL